MNRMTVGQTVYVYDGSPRTVVIAPDPTRGIKALLEFSDGSREWFTLPNIYQTQREAKAWHASEKAREWSHRVRDLENELEEAKDEHAKYQAILDAAKETP